MGDPVASQMTKAMQNGGEVWCVLCFPGVALKNFGSV